MALYLGSTKVSLTIPSKEDSAIQDWAVQFIDYDGTVVAQYTYKQVQSMTTLPTQPTHDKLTAQGWNYTLAEVKQVEEGEKMTVGAVYAPVAGDGAATELDVKFVFFNGDTSATTVTLNFMQDVASGVTIDWGDGSEKEFSTSTGLVTLTHSYAAYFEGTITLTPDESCTLTLGQVDGSSFTALLTDSDYIRYVYEVRVGKAVLGPTFLYNFESLQTVSLSNNTTAQYSTSTNASVFYNCWGLKSLVIPRSITQLGNQFCAKSYSMTAVSIPPTVTTISRYCLRYSYALKTVYLPDSITSGITNSMFYYDYSLTDLRIPRNATCHILGGSALTLCTSLKSLTIPKNITTINPYIVSESFALETVKVLNRDDIPWDNFAATSAYLPVFDFTDCKQVPTVTGTFLDSFPTYIKIIVPGNLYEEWKAADKWSTVASQIVAGAENNQVDVDVEGSEMNVTENATIANETFDLTKDNNSTVEDNTLTIN